MTKIIAIVVIALIIIGGLYYEFRRGSEMEGVAKRLGFSFKSGLKSISSELDQIGFDLFTQGPPNIKNRMEGMRNGNRVVIFDFSYSANIHGEGSRDFEIQDDPVRLETRNQSVIWVQIDDLLPEFDLSPTKIHERQVAQRKGFNQLSFDNQPAFNSQYHLLVRDQERVRALFTPHVIDWLIEHPGLVMESQGENLLFYRFEKRVDPGDVSLFLDKVEELLSLIQKPGP